MFCGKHGFSYLYPLLIQRIIMDVAAHETK
jgi:hypothetical protein